MTELSDIIQSEIIQRRDLDQVPAPLRHLVPDRALSGDEAMAVVATLHEALDEQLRSVVRTWSAARSRSLIASLLGAVSRPLAGAIGTDAYAQTSRATTEMLAGVRYFAECTLVESRGGDTPSQEDIERGLVQVSLVVLLAHLRRRGQMGAHRVSFEVMPDGTELVVRPGLLDTDRWHTDRLASAGTGDAEIDSLSEWLADRVPGGIWREPSRQLQRETGCGLKVLLGTMVVLVRLGWQSDQSLVMSNEELAALVGGAGVRPRNQILPAIQLLTFNEAEAGLSLQPWKQREREHRLAASPLFRAVPSGRVHVIPAHVALSMSVYFTYLSSGSWPAPEGDKKHETPFRQALKLVEDARNADFERMLVNDMLRHGFAAWHGVKSLQDVTLSGDIDCLAMTPRGDQIWVVEAKDPIDVASPPQMRSQIDNFAKTYWKNHDRRVAAVDTPAGHAAVSRLLGVPLAERCNVRSVMVTRRPSPVNYFERGADRPVHLEQFRADLRSTLG